MKLKSTLVAARARLRRRVASAATRRQPARPGHRRRPGRQPRPRPGWRRRARRRSRTTGPIDDIYNFQLADASDLIVTANEFEGPDVQMNPADFTLYSGTSTGTPAPLAPMVGSRLLVHGRLDHDDGVLQRRRRQLLLRSHR